MGEPLDQPPIGEDLERRSRLPPAACDHVVLQFPEVDVSHLGEHVSREIDCERASAQLVIVDIIRVPLRRFVKSPDDIPAAIEEIAGRFSDRAREVSRQKPKRGR